MRTTALTFVAALTVALALPAHAKERPRPEPPADVVIGRHTFFDFGNPHEFYEVVALRPAEGGGTAIERVQVTPPGQRCVQPAAVEVATRTVGASVAELLGGQNPCAIPEKALRRERKRCKDCLVFSGVNVVMQVRCGADVRRIRMDVLDRDLFDAKLRTPEHTSWTMGVLGRVDAVLGGTVMQRPMFALGPPPPPPAPHPLLDAIDAGAFDALVGTEPGTLAGLLADARKFRRPPTIELRTASAFRPVPEPVLVFPDVARLVRAEGDVAFRVDVDAAGAAGDVHVLSGLPFLARSVEAIAKQWTFAPGDAGRVFDGTIAFRMNCDDADR